MTIGLVTDSTAYLPDDLIKSLNIEVVAVQVVVDGQPYSEVSEISIDELILALRSNRTVTTSRPTANNFGEAYERLAATGVTEILSIHLSSKLSGTYESALLASRKSSIPVHVIDSTGVAAFLSLAVKSAARLILAGDPVEKIKAKVLKQCAETEMYFYVDTLEFLERGGRISTVKSKLGSLLTLKPILKMQDGRVESFELVRTEAKAISRLIELATEGNSTMQYEINHVAAISRAEFLGNAIAKILKIDPIEIRQTGAVVATHVGPGAVAIAFTPQL